MGGYAKSCKKQINAVIAIITVISPVKGIMFYPLFLQCVKWLQRYRSRWSLSLKEGGSGAEITAGDRGSCG